jgi:hypothetical protein
MKRGLSDTDPEAERVQLELLQAASPSRRLRLALSLSRTVMGLARDGLARGLPGASAEEIGLRFVALNYGRELAEDVREYLARSREPGGEPLS